MQTSSRKFDLEQRCLTFSKQLLIFCKNAPKTIANIEIIKQLVRSGTSIGANYLEANDSLGKKDFLHKLRISRKEAKETIYWLNLIEHSNEKIRLDLARETTELRNILSAIIRNSETKESV